nr:hypothetical protein [Massilia solisilvae]
MLAVPFQGFASATMMPCAHSSGHSSPATHAMQGHADCKMAAHHGEAGKAASQDCKGKTAHHDGKCSNCSFCCVGAALAAQALSTAAPHAPVTTAIPFADGHVPTVDPEHPERPPRFARA